LRDQNSKHAAKLISIYVKQTEALDNRRSKGQPAANEYMRPALVLLSYAARRQD
jgi:hypothetical protein